MALCIVAGLLFYFYSYYPLSCCFTYQTTTYNVCVHVHRSAHIPYLCLPSALSGLPPQLIVQHNLQSRPLDFYPPSDGCTLLKVSRANLQGQSSAWSPDLRGHMTVRVIISR